MFNADNNGKRGERYPQGGEDSFPKNHLSGHEKSQHPKFIVKRLYEQTQIVVEQ
jgi:hypothetical protein